MKKIILYTSGQLKKAKQTGGVKRFLELLYQMPDFCDLILVSGDEDYEVPNKVRHVSMHQGVEYNKELKNAINNRNYLREIKREGYNWLIVFDVPPAIWLVLFGMPNLCLMIRKDLIAYTKIMLNDCGVKVPKKIVVLAMMLFAESITYLYAKKIIVQCEYDKQQLLIRHKLIKRYIDTKICVQINNVNPSWVTKKEIERKMVNPVFSVVSVSNFSDTRKGFDIFLEAIKILIDEGEKIQASIVGDGKYWEMYKKMYSEYKNIDFVGRIENPSEYIQKFDLDVVPSKADSCPNTVMEAIYNSVPVIASGVGGIPEILENEDALFDLQPRKLAEKIRFYSNNSFALELLKRQQQKRKKELTFDWSKKIVEIIES